MWADEVDREQLLSCATCTISEEKLPCNSTGINNYSKVFYKKYCSMKHVQKHLSKFESLKNLF